MFRPSPQGPITHLRMASTFMGRPVYAVSAYAFADLLIDTGPPQTAAELVEWCRGSAVRRVDGEIASGIWEPGAPRGRARTVGL